MHTNFDWKWMRKANKPVEEKLRSWACLLATALELGMVFLILVLRESWILLALLILLLLLYAVGAYVCSWIKSERLDLPPERRLLSRSQKTLFVFMVAWVGMALGWAVGFIALVLLNFSV